MSAFLTPYPSFLSSDAAVNQPRGSESTLSFLSSKNSSTSNFFKNASHNSSSASLTDVTPPITPSHNIYDRDIIGKSYEADNISDDPLIGPFKQIFDARARRGHHESDDDDAGYITDSEKEQDTPLALVEALLNKCEVGVEEEEYSNPTASNDPNLQDEPLSSTSMPVVDVVVTKAEEAFGDWNGDFGTKDLDDKMDAPLLEDPGRTPTRNVSFPNTKDQLWKAVHSEFEQAFHEGIAEDVGRSFFPYETQLHPATTFAFGTGGISGWREQSPTSGGSNFLLDTYRELVALSPIIMPDTPVLRSLDESTCTSDQWEASSLSSNNSPSLVFDSSVSMPISQMLISPQPNPTPTALEGPFASPGVYDMSFINPNSPLNSPLVAISTLLFASRHARMLPGDMVFGPQNLDLPALMRLEITAALAAQQSAVNDDAPNQRLGLGLEIAPSQFPESSFPSCNSLPSIYSLPSFDAALHAMLETSSSSPQQQQDAPRVAADADENSVTAASIEVEVEKPFVAGDVSHMMDVSTTETRHALTDISEESSRAVALVSAFSDKNVVGLGLGGLAESSLQSSASISVYNQEHVQDSEPDIVGLGLGGLVEAALQSSPSISLMYSMHSLQLPVFDGIRVDDGLEMSESMADVVDG